MGRLFADKLAQKENGTALMPELARKRMWGNFWGTPIRKGEVFLATRYIPKFNAPGPDLIPNEMHIGCPSMHEVLAVLFTKMIEHPYIPKMPSGKPGKG